MANQLVTNGYEPGLDEATRRAIFDLRRRIGEGGGGTGGDGHSLNEVFIGPDDPGFEYELWYDTDDTYATPGTVLWQSYTNLSFGSTMNGYQDIEYPELAGSFPFPTISYFECSAMYLNPDRATPINAVVYSNNYNAPGGGGLIYCNVIGNAPAAAPAQIGGTLVASQIRAANAGNMTWVLRLGGVQGGPTNYGFNGHMVMRRIAA